MQPLGSRNSAAWPSNQAIKLIVIIVLTFQLTTSHPLYSAEQFSQDQCEQLQYTLTLNREQQRAGYALREAAQIKDEELQLERQLRHSCSQPTLEEAGDLLLTNTRQIRKPKTAKAKASNAATKARIKTSKQQGKITTGSDKAGLRTTMQPQAQHRHFLASLIELRTPYTGEQQQAWIAWYQEPYWCYGVKKTAHIVDCVNQRQKAQAQFESWWQSQSLSDQ